MRFSKCLGKIVLLSSLLQLTAVNQLDTNIHKCKLSLFPSTLQLSFLMSIQIHLHIFPCPCNIRILQILCSVHFGYCVVQCSSSLFTLYNLLFVIFSDEYSSICIPHRSGIQPCLKGLKLEHFFGLVLMSKLMEVIPTYMYHMTGILCYSLPRLNMQITNI